MNKLYINRIITFLLAGVIIFQLYKNNKIEQANKGKNISSLEFYSMKEKKNISMSEILKKDSDKTLYIWATWCPPCRLQNKIIDLYLKLGLKSEKDLIRISVDQDRRALKKYLQTENLEGHYNEPNGFLFSDQIIRGTPSFIDIGPSGKIKNIDMGINFIF